MVPKGPREIIMFLGMLAEQSLASTGMPWEASLMCKIPEEPTGNIMLHRQTNNCHAMKVKT